jgi:WD40 repeat protein
MAMNITKSVYGKFDTRLWHLKRYKDYFFAYHAYNRAFYKVFGNTLELAFEYPQDVLSAFDIHDANLIAGTKHGELILWDIDAVKPKRVFSLNQDLWIRRVKFLDADLIALDIPLDLQFTVIYSLHQEKIIDTIPFSNGSNLQDAQYNRLLVFDKLKGGLCLFNWQERTSHDFGLSEDVISPVFSPDGRFIVCQNSYDLPTSNIELLVYEREGLRLLQRIDTLSTSGGTRYLVFDKYLVATMTDHNQIGIWDIRTGKNILIEQVQLSWINYLDFDPESRELIIGTGHEYFLDEYIIEIWKIS